MTIQFTNPFTVGKLIAYAVLLVIAFVGLICPSHARAQAADAKKASVVFSEKDREAAITFLNETRSEFANEISNLSDAQLSFKTAPDKWSVAEVAEHIILAENTIYNIISENVVKSPAPAGADNFRLKDSAIWMVLTNRSTKFTAPEQLRPANRFKTKADILSNFASTRARTIDYISNTKEDLRNRFGELPVLGTIDGFQWFVFVNAHSARHLAQIAEIKADPKFPKK